MLFMGGTSTNTCPHKVGLIPHLFIIINVFLITPTRCAPYNDYQFHIQTSLGHNGFGRIAESIITVWSFKVKPKIIKIAVPEAGIWGMDK